MIIIKLLFICMALIAILHLGMVPTVFAQDLFLKKQDKIPPFFINIPYRTNRVKKSQIYSDTEVLISRYVEKFKKGSPCKTPDNNSGVCINIKQCPLLLNILKTQGLLARDYLRQRLCNFDGINAIVCCPDSKRNRFLNNDDEDQLLKPPKCGISNETRTRVVGGVPAMLGAWPWIAALGFQSQGNSSQVQWRCGGSLISARHVLTAAHCAIDNNLSVVRIGDLDLKRTDDGAHPIEAKIERKIIHPLYRSELFEYDIAVLKLADDVPFSTNLHPVCLPIEPTLRNNTFVNRSFFVAGWGSQTPNGSAVDHLMEVEVTVISNERCRKRYGNKRGAVIDNRVICAGFRFGKKDACKGDSGGPLTFAPEEYSYQIGVVSYGYECALPGYAGVYTRVSTFIDFIIFAMQQ